MRIGFLIYGDINAISGGYLFDRKIIEYLKKQGDEVSIISLHKNNYFQDVLFNQPATSIDFHNLDILIEDELVHPSIFKTNLYIKKRLPVIALVHLFRSYSMQPGYINWFYKHIEKKYLSSVDGLILNSESTQSQASQLMGNLLVNNIVAYPAGNNFTNSASEDIQVQKNSINQPLKLLYIGNIIRQKGLHILLDALSLLRRNTFRLTITGRMDMEPGYVNQVKQLISNHHLSDLVEFTGPLPLNALPSLYQAHHLMALPSRNEAFGIVYLEAMQFGLPVIGTTSGGAKEIIEHGVNGYLIHPGDSNQLAEYLNHLIETPDKLLIMSNNAIHSYHQHPTWDETAHNIREFLLSYVNKGKTSGR